MAVVPAWIEAHCIVPDGFRKGQGFRHYDWQLLYTANMYRVRGDVEYDPVNPVLGPAFVYRRGLLVGPQKVGKNPLIATHVCVEGVGPALFAGWAGHDEGWVCAEHGCRCGWEYPYEPGEPMGMTWPTPLIQITAYSEESTDNTYDWLRPMIDEGPLHDLIPRTGEEFIRLPGGGRIDTVTSSHQSRLGQRVTYVPQDEVGIWTPQNKMTKLADVQYRGLAGMGGRASLTSNAWDPAEHSVAQREYESAATDVYRQFLQPPKTLSYGDRRERHRIHRIVYPRDTLRENGGHLDLDSIEREAADLVEKDPAQAARFYGNMIVAGAGYAVPAGVWDDLAEARDVPLGARIGAGFDGSVSGDATSLRACTADGYRFSLPGWTWERPPGAKDWRVPRLAVRKAIVEMFGRFDVGLMLCDPPWWRTEIEEWAEMFGKERVLAFDTNQYKRMAPAFDRWRTAIGERAAKHDGDPIVSEHVKALHVRKVRGAAPDEDGRTLYMPVKGDDARKIDGALADILAFEAAMTMPPASAISVYEERGLLFV